MFFCTTGSPLIGCGCSPCTDGLGWREAIIRIFHPWRIAGAPIGPPVSPLSNPVTPVQPGRLPLTLNCSFVPHYRRVATLVQDIKHHLQHLLLIYQLACTLRTYDIASCPEAYAMQCLKVVVVILTQIWLVWFMFQNFTVFVF